MAFYVAITGLRLHSVLKVPRFFALAAPAMADARAAPGNRFADARTIRGVHHTLSAWDSLDALTTWVHQPAHARAMRAQGALGTGVTTRFEAEALPSWDEARQIWDKVAAEAA